MNPKRKRTTRLVVSLTAAVLLASALVYTSFSASSEARSPSQLRDAAPGRSYELTGRVVPGYRREGDVLVFRVRDRSGSSRAAVPVRYAGAGPGPFGGGGGVSVPVGGRGTVLVGGKASLVRKCRWKFGAARAPSGGRWGARRGARLPVPRGRAVRLRGDRLGPRRAP